MNKSFLRKIAVLSAVVLASSTLFFGCGGDRPSVEGESLPELVVASDYYAPYIYRDEKGDFVGIDVELITEICKHVGLKPVFRHIDWSGKNEVLSSGGADCLCGSFSLTGREDEYSWTLPYMNSRQVVAVPQDSDIYWISDLKDKRVAVQATTKPDEIFSGKKNEKIVVPKLKELNCFPDITYIVAALNGGFVDAIAGHEVVLREYMKSSSVKIRILEEPLLEVEIGLAFLKNTHHEIIEKMNSAIYILRNNGYLARLVSSYGLDPDAYLVNYEKA